MDLKSLPRPLASSTTISTRPANLRSSTDPSPSALLPGWFKEKEKEDFARPSSGNRNRSPYSRSHLRSRSSGALLNAPVMTRAHSLPNPYILRPSDQSGSSSGSASPQRSPGRARSPFKEEGGYLPPPRSPGWFDSPSSAGAIEAIQEDSELDITPRPQSAHNTIATPQYSSRSASLRRRPASPLHNISTSQQLAPTSFPAAVIDQHAVLNPHSGSSSPTLAPQKYNEGYPLPSLHHYASSSSFSSIPSTPTSARSRSPSVSSLGTIEDAPEEESEAVELERIERLERLRIAAERDESDSEGEGTGTTRRKGSLDSAPRWRSGGRERKRWSVCGGERRADLDLETIWED